MIKIKFYTFYVCLLSVFFGSVLDHQPTSTIEPNRSLDLEIFSNFPNDDIVKSEIYFKTDNQIAYIKENLIKSSDSYFNFSLSPDLVVGEYISYYFVFQLSNDEYVTSPPINPHENPFSVKVLHNDFNDDITNSKQDYINPDYEIIAPLNNQKLLMK